MERKRERERESKRGGTRERERVKVRAIARERGRKGVRIKTFEDHQTHGILVVHRATWTMQQPGRAQEQGCVDDAKRLLLRVGQELQQTRAQGCSKRTTSELKRSIKTLTRNAQILDRKVKDLEYVLRSRENSKRRQAQVREVVVQARVETRQMKEREEREQAVPVVASFPRVETRQMKRARLS